MARRKSVLSRAQRIALKHNGNCRRLEGAIVSIRAIMDDCVDTMPLWQEAEINVFLNGIKAAVRNAVDEQFKLDGEKK